MTALALHRFAWSKLRLTRMDVLRLICAGAAWGVAMSAGIAAMTFWNCGMICPDDIAATTVISVVTGMLAIGPVAVYGRR